MKRRTSMRQAPMETFLLATGNQSVVPSGEVVGSGNDLNIDTNQFGIESADPAGTVKPGNFIAASTSSTAVKAIKIVQGTPASENLSLVNPFGIGYPAKVETTPLVAGQIRSVATRLPELPRFQMTYISGVSGLVEAKRYYLNLSLNSQRGDQTYGMARETLISQVTLPASTTDDADYVLQKLALDMNRSSVAVGQTDLTSGNRPIIVFGIDDAGGSGTTIGTLAAGDTFNFAQYTVGGTTRTYSYTADTTFINSLHEAIGNEAGLSTATIEVLGSVTPGSAATVTGLLVVALREQEALVFDDIKEFSVRAQVGFGAPLKEVQPTYTQEEVSSAFEGHGLGRQIALMYDDRARQQIFTLQNHVSRNEYPLRPANPFSTTALYTTTTIDYYDEVEHLNGDALHEKLAVIVLPAEIDDDTADADTGYTLATTATTTVTGLNNILSYWLNTVSGIQYLGDAVAGTVFV